MPLQVHERAAAKINLSLHVTGKRADGYHLLDTLVVFAQSGDEVTIEPANHRSLTIDGPFAHELHAGPDNLVWRAAELMVSTVPTAGSPTHNGFSIHLTKNLPVASGLGGGSADAAAVIRGFGQVLGFAADDFEPGLTAGMTTLGADVPMCFHSRPARAQGVGDELTLMELPRFDMVLLNPGIGISTAEIFRRLPKSDNEPMHDPLPGKGSLNDWIRTLSAQRNDLQAVAIDLVPQIGSCLAALENQPGCLFARMSGSGASCFGLFDSQANARAAQKTIAAQEPTWWAAATQTLSDPKP